LTALIEEKTWTAKSAVRATCFPLARARMTGFSNWRLDGEPRAGAGSRFLLAAGGEKLAADGLEEVASPEAN
jgi:hypothetical protein